MNDNTIPKSVPLCVDLDGSFLQGDVLNECLRQLVRRNPLYLFMLPLWLLRGLAYFKHRVCADIELDIGALPVNQAVRAWLLAEKAAGREIVLVTAAERTIAAKVWRYFNTIFEHVISSTPQHNLKGKNKRDELDRIYGKYGYDYVGNERPDLQIWRHARAAILVKPSRWLERATRRQCNVIKVFR
jgi:phosphoserine phosphatase